MRAWKRAVLAIDGNPVVSPIQRAIVMKGDRMSTTIKGSCLCGAVTFAIDGKYSPAGQCHCSKCRKVSGTDGNAVFLASYGAFRWLGGEDNTKTFVVPGSTWKSRFCFNCGSPVPFPSDDKKICFVPAGLLDDDPGFRGYARHIFVGSKAPGWLSLTAPPNSSSTHQEWPDLQNTGGRSIR